MSFIYKLYSTNFNMKYFKGQKMAKMIKNVETMFSKFERSLESLADKIL